MAIVGKKKKKGLSKNEPENLSLKIDSKSAVRAKNWREEGVVVLVLFCTNLVKLKLYFQESCSYVVLGGNWPEEKLALGTGGINDTEAVTLWESYCLDAVRDGSTGAVGSSLFSLSPTPDLAFLPDIWPDWPLVTAGPSPNAEMMAFSFLSTSSPVCAPLAVDVPGFRRVA